MVVLLLFSIILMVIHFVYIKIKVKINAAMKYFLNAHWMLIIWGTFLLLKLITPQHINEKAITYLMTISIIFVGYHLFIFAYSYIKKTISNKHSTLLVIPPFFSFILYSLGTFIYESLGYILRFCAVTVVVGYLIAGLVFFAIYIFKTEGFKKTKQWTYFYTVVGFDVLAHLIFYLDMLNISNRYLIYLMPLYLIFLMAFTIKYRLYDKMPFVLETIFHNANQGIIVMNNDHTIIECNTKFFKNYMNIDELDTLDDFISKLKEITDNKLSVDNILYAVKNLEKNQISGDVKICKDSTEQFLAYTVNIIYDHHGQKIATMIAFRDMTEMTCLQNGIRKKNNQLMRANNKLEEHMKNVQELTVEKERAILMAEINDTFGHTMTELIALLEVCILRFENEYQVESVEKAIDEAKDRARAALEQMREAVSRYKKEVIAND